MKEPILFNIEAASRLLVVDMKTLTSILTVSDVSTNYENNGHIGVTTLRMLYSRLYPDGTTDLIGA